MIAVHAIGNKGRATPLVWETVEKRKLKANRNRLETLVIERLREAVPENAEIIVLADRGFGDVERYAQLKDSWILATKLPDDLMKASVAKNPYAKRFRACTA